MEGVEFNWVKLPLFDSWDYTFTITLDGVSYTIRMYYSDRAKQWSMDLYLEEGEILVEGEIVSPYKPSIYDRVDSVGGYFWLEPIALDDNETFDHPDLLFKYFNFYYIS